PREGVTLELRRRAKTSNFGVSYGQTDFGLGRQLGIPRKEAQKCIAKYFERYQGVAAYMERMITEARRDGAVKTLLGRRRAIRDINSENRVLRGMAERIARNAPIQGTAADIIKIAMVRVARRL